MRVSSLTNLGVAIERDIPSGYDDIQDVAAIADEVQVVADNIADIVAVAGDLPDIATVTAAGDLINNLSASATTITSELPATAQVVGTNITFEIPKGKDGTDGRVPDVVFSVDGAGNLQYEVTGYVEGTTQEW